MSRLEQISKLSSLKSKNKIIFDKDDPNKSLDLRPRMLIYRRKLFGRREIETRRKRRRSLAKLSGIFGKFGEHGGRELSTVTSLKEGSWP